MWLHWPVDMCVHGQGLSKLKNGKSWHGGIKPIVSQMWKLELSALFRRTGTFDATLSIFHVEAHEMPKSLNLRCLYGIGVGDTLSLEITFDSDTICLV